MDTLVQNINLIKGESSDIYQFSSKEYPTFDNDWVGNLVIRKNTIGGDVVLARSLPKNEATENSLADSSFVFQLTPNESDLIGVGRFFISIEIRNDVKNFNKEIVQTGFTIKESGI